MRYDTHTELFRAAGRTTDFAFQSDRKLLWSDRIGWRGDTRTARFPSFDVVSNSASPQLEFHHPLGANPSPGRWRRFIDHLLELEEDYFDLLVIDSVMSFLPAAQNNPRGLRWALNELRLVAGLPAGVLLLHQASAVRSRLRARGPLTAFADILIDMQAPPLLAPFGREITSGAARRRHFYGVGRYRNIPAHVAAELNADGTDYTLLPDEPADALLGGMLETLRQLLSENPEPLTRQEIVARWPAAEPPPRPDSLWRTLTRGCEQGILIRSGAGTKAEAFRYGVAQDKPAA